MAWRATLAMCAAHRSTSAQVTRNETSIERVKKTWRGRANPYDRGAFRNWLDFCFRATPSVVLELDQVESRCEAA